MNPLSSSPVTDLDTLPDSLPPLLPPAPSTLPPLLDDDKVINTIVVHNGTSKYSAGTWWGIRILSIV